MIKDHNGPVINSVENADDSSTASDSTDDDEDSESNREEHPAHNSLQLQSRRELNGVALPSVEPSTFGNFNIDSSSKIRVGNSSSHVYNGTVKIKQIIYTNTEQPNKTKFVGNNSKLVNDQKFTVVDTEGDSQYQSKNNTDDVKSSGFLKNWINFNCIGTYNFILDATSTLLDILMKIPYQIKKLVHNFFGYYHELYNITFVGKKPPRTNDGMLK